MNLPKGVLDLKQMKNFLDTVIERASYPDNPTLDQVYNSYEILFNRVKDLQSVLEFYANISHEGKPEDISVHARIILDNE